MMTEELVDRGPSYQYSSNLVGHFGGVVNALPC